MRKTVLLFLIASFLTSCLIDITDQIETSHINIKDINEIINDLDISIYSNNKLKDTIDFPILGWESISNRDLKIERFQEAKDAGINHNLSGFSNVDSVQKALDLGQEVGIKIFIWCPELKTKTTETVNKFKNHPANAGYFLQDEPSASEIPTLKNLNKLIESIDNTRFSYINLHPNTGTPNTLRAEDYEDYVNRFITEIPLKTLSFDHYPIEHNAIRYIWYQNLEIIRNETRKANIPFWAFALTSAHWNYSIPTMEHLRLQVYSNLAYGAKGIQYFTFRIPSNTIYTSAPIDRNGNKTNEYYLLEEINKEIQALSYIFLSSEVTNVSHFGTTPVGTKTFSNYPRNIKSLNIRGGNALISELKNSTNTFLLIQNNNLHSEIGIEIETDTDTKIVLKNGTILPASLIDEEFKLVPGDIVILMK